MQKSLKHSKNKDVWQGLPANLHHGYYMRSQLYLWGSPVLGGIFACVAVFVVVVFFYPTIEVVTFRLRG